MTVLSRRRLTLMWRSRSVRVLVAVVPVIAALLTPVKALAYDGAGCSKAWNQPNSQGKYVGVVTPGSAKCSFAANGTPIQLSGEASSSSASGTVQIHVWVSPGGSPEVILAECGKTDKGWVGCGEEFTPIVLDARRPQVAPGTSASLQCNVTWTGNREGGAGCFTPEPCPQIGQLGCVKVLGTAVDCWARLDSCPRPAARQDQDHFL